MPMGLPLLAVVALAWQGGDTSAHSRGSAPRDPASPLTVSATRAIRPPVIDGRDDDEVWQHAQPIDQFREFQPVEDGPPRFRTVAKVAYDNHNFYAFIRAYDPHPDSILRLLARRDVRPPTDQLKIIIDSYHDRRTGYEFAVNPAGVKRDYAIYSDQHEDEAWDGVWEVATTVDSLGWTAEFRIPLSQLRYPKAAHHTFGFAVWRDIERYTERVSWPVYRGSRAGLASQLGEVVGLDGLASPRRLEVAPYTVSKNLSVAHDTGGGFGRSQDFTVGADIKYGITSNLTLDATVNPDFGQVEADPAVLNLTAFETFFHERRPFFVEGTGIFRFDVDCSQVNCNGEGLFYSRRIGRAPQLLGTYGVPSSSTATTILGAGKLTGRLPGGLSVGVLEALTQRATGRADTTIEPRTNYSVVRLQQDLQGGQSGVGLLLTGVNRDLDPATDTLLRREAYVAALDGRHRFANNRFEVSGSVDLSRVAGTPQAIAATQRDAVHYYQRPDAGLPYDTTRTVLSGDAEELKFGKIAGRRTNFETSYLRRSPGFEVNDLGFLLRADQQSWNNWLGLHFNDHPNRVFQQAYWNFNWWQYWTGHGMPQERALNTNAHVQLNSRWWVSVGGTGQLGGVFDDRSARGGPAVRRSPGLTTWVEFDGDDRHVFVPGIFFVHWHGDAGHSDYFSTIQQLSIRVSSQFQPSLGVSFTRNVADQQPVGPFTDAAKVVHYTFAHLYQRTLSLTARIDYTLSTVLTLQVYASPFISKGTYTNPRELAAPRAAEYAARYRPFSDTAFTNSLGGFNYKQFNSNVVLRWEYRPGSTLFLVWTQGRQGAVGAMGVHSFAGDIGDLFDLHPANTFLVKASYWLSW